MATYVIVGASKGIGKEIALKLIQENHRVINFSRTASELQGIENFIWDAESSASEIFQSVNEPIAGLVYAPGTINLKPFNRFTIENFEKDLRINFLGAVEVIQTLLPQLKAAGSSSIVLFSTVAVQTGMSFHASIASSKGAIEGLTKSLAAEFASLNIKVNAIAPSLTKTELAGALVNSPEKIEVAAKRHPLNKIGEPEEIADLAYFLLSPKNSWMTGQILHLDGGLSTLKPL
ncbi:SDR family oxidoreductase [Sandaracinomonas limnophila]|uniref:SDR family oxidoreductase n=1 Tax=Sandaracinomonas limnophila TaxID=1862386 RepID=A0A437PWF4_9BACT|nr:SDR family oxidoreductase [Sandaracinomonas limnophila]RVU26595.1 SDR family oxidoreductase [Sandaracinomonas limnophila]